MKQIHIFGTNLTSSTIALGGVPFGSKMNEEDSFALMDAYVSQGGNMIDTAEVRQLAARRKKHQRNHDWEMDEIQAKPQSLGSYDQGGASRSINDGDSKIVSSGNY